MFKISRNDIIIGNKFLISIKILDIINLFALIFIINGNKFNNLISLNNFKYFF